MTRILRFLGKEGRTHSNSIVRLTEEEKGTCRAGKKKDLALSRASRGEGPEATFGKKKGLNNKAKKEAGI